MIYPKLEPGCYCDCSALSAQTLNERIVALAEAYGFDNVGSPVRDDFDVWNEAADEAVDYLNGLETRPGMYWTIDDNSLFLSVDVDIAKEDVEFVSSRECEYPDDDFRGEWLHVNDHGNVTLYIRCDGEGGDDSCRDEEVWAVV